MKKSIGIILVVLGLVLGGIGLAQQSSDNVIIEIDDLEVARSREHNIHRMIIAGGVMAAGGIAVLLVKKVN